LPEIDKPTEIKLEKGDSLLFEPIHRRASHVQLEGFSPCVVLLNNDLSSGVPSVLQNTHGQVFLPPLHAGWATRRKSRHFGAYEQVSTEFADQISIDAWRINPLFTVCQSVNFHERQGEDKLANNVDAILREVREKYRKYGVKETPYVVVKADAGTYGMGVMTVKDAEQVIGLNRRQRNKMSVIKEGVPVSEVLVQEGVHTFEQIGDSYAEPVVYMVDRYVVGGFYRIHTERGKDENLNAPGMHFYPLGFETYCNTPDPQVNPDAPPNRFYAYGVVARLACVAAAMELKAMASTSNKADLGEEEAMPPDLAQALPASGSNAYI